MAASEQLYLVLVLSLCVSLGMGDVIIGEMLEGHSYNKRITLRNTGPSSEPLSAYGLNVYMNADGATVYRLHSVSDATLGAQEEFSICHPRSTENCDREWSGIIFNGNDRIELTREGVPVDVIGQPGGVGVTSGGWTVAGTRAATVDHLLVRKDEIESGNLDWPSSADSEWLVYTLGGQLIPQSESPSPASPQSSPASPAIFDDACWSAAGALGSLSLDSCAVPIEKESVVFGSYNTEFLFDGMDDPRAQSRWDGPEEAERHLRDIAAVIQQDRPDIMALQEVEDMNILRDLVAEIREIDYNPFLVQGRDVFTGQDVALVVQEGIDRPNVSRTDCRTNEVPAGSRCGASLRREIGVSKNMIALFDSCLFGRKFAVITVHFYAFPTARVRCIEREAQARIIQDVLVRLIEAGFEVILAGDLNDYSDVFRDAAGSVPTSRVLSMLRDPDNDGRDDLTSFLEMVPRPHRYSAWYDRDDDGDFTGVEEATQIDHILMTTGLHSRVTRAWMNHDPDPERVSDHWPLYVEFDTSPLKAT